MSDVFRNRVIRTLIGELASLTGGDFEQFGYKMMNFIHPGDWVGRGTTVEGKPRGYTVDSSEDGATNVAEMSTEGDYYEGSMKKPLHDLEHVVSLHSDVKRIWLLSAVEATASETTQIANIVTNFKQAHCSISNVEIYDSRRISKRIFEHLGSEQLIRDIGGYLPSLRRLSDEHAFSHRIPKFLGYQPRSDLEVSVVNQLQNNTVVVITGVSGIGKTALASAIAQKMEPDFDYAIWIDAHDLQKPDDLSDIDVRRSGIRHNVEGLLRRHRCLLILDDLAISSDNFSAIVYDESKVIITCQATYDCQAIHVKDLDCDSARSLLELGINPRCPESIFLRVFSSVGGYPLLLSILNQIAKDEGWESVYNCCPDATESLEDDKHNKVCQRILIQHQMALAKELAFVKWCGMSRFDGELLAICVSIRAVDNLNKRGFLTATAPEDIRVHDVVYQSICAVINVSMELREDFRRKIELYISKECNNNNFVLRRIAKSHSTLLIQLLQETSRPSFVYALALARPIDTPLALLGDPVLEANQIAGYSHWDGNDIEILAIIEVVEALYTIIMFNDGAEAARASLETNIEAISILRDCANANGELLRDLKHHYAKMLVRLGKIQDAEDRFREILNEHPTFAAGRLQLARIFHRSKRKQEALIECQQIIQQHKSSQKPVFAPILLEALVLMATIGTVDDLRLNKELIMSSLQKARELDRSLALRLIAVVAPKMWYTNPDFVSTMFNSIEWRDALPPSDSECFDWAQAHKSAAKAVGKEDSRYSEFLVVADEMYKRMVSQSGYKIVQYSEVLILLEKFDEAKAVLNSVSENNRDEFWWQRMAQALHGLNRFVPALEAINKGLDDLRDAKYKSAFLEYRYRIKKSMGVIEAENDLYEAINLLEEGDKYREELEKLLTDSFKGE